MESLVRISIQNDEQVTSVATFKLGLLKTLFFAGGEAAHTLEGIPGLKAGVVYRSYDKQQIIEYLQWENLAAFEAGGQSAAYRDHRAAIGGETALAATPCEVVFVDDARPGTDQFDSVLITEKAECLTMIGIFEVQPGRREELIDLLKSDHESFLSKFDGFIGVAFHRALQDENKLIEVLQFKSLEAFKQVPETTTGAAHLAAVARLTTNDHNIYHVHSVFGKASEDASKALA